MTPERLRLLFDRVAEAGCHCPENIDLERENLADHTCLPALAEEAARALTVTQKRCQALNEASRAYLTASRDYVPRQPTRTEEHKREEARQTHDALLNLVHDLTS
jgi:hypothetical protein